MELSANPDEAGIVSFGLDMLETVYERRKIGGCFYPLIQLHCTWDSVWEQLEIANRTEKAVVAMMNGQCSPDEMLEMIEDCYDMDAYLNEVEENLEEASKQLIWLQ